MSQFEPPRDRRSHLDVAVTTVTGDRSELRDDVVVVEEPLSIAVAVGDQRATVATTMRTPGDDLALALGFLWGEGVVTDPADVLDVSWCRDRDDGDRPRSSLDGLALPLPRNVATVRLRGAELPDLGHLQRHGTVSSACGVCGRLMVDTVAGSAPAGAAATATSVDRSVVTGLPARLRSAQRLFAATGGLHAAARFTLDGRLLDVREDVGRHNAMDKLVGAAVRGGEAVWEEQLLLLSGRASWELLAKAAAVAVPVVAAVGAPSSLAVEVADRVGITLVGFLRGDRFNVYTHPDRLVGSTP